MRVSLFGFNSFQNAISIFGSPTGILYTQNGGTVQKATAFYSDKIVEADMNLEPLTPFLSAFPAALEVTFNLNVEI